MASYFGTKVETLGRSVHLLDESSEPWSVTVTIYSCAALYATEPEAYDSRAGVQTLPVKIVASWTPGMSQQVCRAWRSEFDPPNHMVGRENQLPQTVFWPPHVRWSSIDSVHKPTDTRTINTCKKQFKVCAPVPKAATKEPMSLWFKALPFPPCALPCSHTTENLWQPLCA